MKRSVQETTDVKRRALGDVTNTPPTTPTKQRVVELADGPESARRKLFTPPTTPQKPKFSSVYSKAKALFQRGCCETRTLVGREAEAQALGHFLIDCIAKNTSGSLYISGPPGTGKSAQVDLSLRTLGDGGRLSIGEHTATVLRLNCMSLARPEAVFGWIHEQLSGARSRKQRTSDDVYAALRAGAASQVVLVLDELDVLWTTDQQVLFELFNLSARAHSEQLATKVVLVGISNSLDLTDKLLPRLRRNGLGPQTVQFKPYGFEQIRRIITAKLQSLVEDDKENVPGTPIVNPGAVVLCCKKTAAISGDLRKAFDMVVRSIELLEAEVTGLQQWGFADAPKVQISHVAKVCSDAMGPSGKMLRTLNLMQKVVLTYLFNYRAEEPGTPTVNGLYAYYARHCGQAKLLTVLKRTEFLEVVGALESHSLVVLSGASVQPNVTYGELAAAVQDVGILKKILM